MGAHVPRIVEITVPADQTKVLLSRARQLPDVIGVRVQMGIAVQPPGDVITVVITDKALPVLFQLLDSLKITGGDGCSITTVRPIALLSSSSADAVEGDVSHFISEEINQEINHESSMSYASIAAMAISGWIAVIGIETNTLHVVIGAMVIAPGFKPISRVALGLVHRTPSWKPGVIDFLKAYGALISGAVLATLVMRQLGHMPLDTPASYLARDALIRYWTQTTAASYLVSVVAGVAGALLIIGQRSVLTAGVMIALSLIPSACIIGMGMAVFDGSLALNGLQRFAVEVLIVMVTSALVFWCNAAFVEKRRRTS